MRGVAAGWASIAHGISSPARARPMVRSAGVTRLGCGHEGGKYFHFQSIIFDFSANGAGCLDRCASCALLHRPSAHIMSRPGHHYRALWRYSYEPRSLGQPSSPLPSHLSPQPAAQLDCHCYSVCAWAHTLLCLTDKLSQ